MLTTLPGRRGAVAARARRRHLGRPGRRGAAAAGRRRARRRAAGRGARRLLRAAGARPGHRRPRGLGAAPGGGARRRRGRRAAEPAARRPRRRRRRRPRRGRRRSGAPSCPPTPGRDTTGILTAVRDGQLAGLLVGGVDPADLPDPALAEAALAAAGFVVSLEMFPSAVTEWADVVLPVAAAAGEGRQLPRLGGPGPVLRRHPARHRPAARRPRAAGPGRRDGRRPAAAHPRGGPRRARRARARPAVPARASGSTSPPPRRRRTCGDGRGACSPPGGSCSTSARCSATSPSSPAPPARRWPGSAPDAAAPARPRRRRPADRQRGDRLGHPAGAGDRDARPGGLAADEVTGQRGPHRPRHRPRWRRPAAPRREVRR